jgi:hypothetical protein
LDSLAPPQRTTLFVSSMNKTIARSGPGGKKRVASRFPLPAES